MANMKCRCGNTMWNGNTPNGIEYWVYSDRQMCSIEEEDSILTIDLADKANYNVWCCPKCMRLYVFDEQGDSTQAKCVYRLEENDTKQKSAGIDYEKYYAPRKYQKVQAEIQEKVFDEEEKLLLLRDMIDYIQDKNYRVYHDFMDDICVSNPDWFNMLIFDRNKKLVILDFIKARAKKKVK